MRIPFLYAVIFFAFIGMLSVLVFPDNREMADLFLQAGDIRKAKNELELAFNDTSGDFELYMTASHVYHLLGRPEKAIAALRLAQEHKPRNLTMLNRLAQYLEWDMRPKEALDVYEAIVRENPARLDVLRTLVSHYRYFGMEEKESHALARLIPEETYPVSMRDDPLLWQFRQVLPDLARKRLDDGPDPYRDLLMQRLYIVGEQYVAALGDPEEEVVLDQYIQYSLEYYLMTGFYAEAETFATNVDALLGGVDSRLRLATIMGWQGLIPQGIAVLKRLASRVPRNEQVLKALAVMSRDAGDLESAEFALERLTTLRPESKEYKADLAEVYLNNNKFAEAVDMFDRLLAQTVDALQYLSRFLTAALFSGDEGVMRTAAVRARDFPTDNVDVLSVRIDLHLALDESAEAYPLLKSLAEQREGDRDTLEQLIAVASYTNNERTVLDAVTYALTFYPDDAALLEQAAGAYVAVGSNVDAYRMMARLAKITGTEHDAVSMLEIAGFSNNVSVIREAAKQAVRWHPASVTVYDLAAEIHLWIERPELAYPFAKRAAELSGGKRQMVMRMVEVASFTGDTGLFRDALVAAGAMRPDDQEIALVAAEALAAQGQSNEFERLLTRFLSTSGRNFVLVRKWARIADTGGLTEQAFRLWNQLYRHDPSDKEAREAVIRLAGWTERYEVAAEILGRQSDAAPDDAGLAFRAGEAWAATAETEKAYSYFARAAQLDPQNIAVQRQLALYSLYTGRYTQAVASFERIGIQSLTQEERFQLAEAYVLEGRGRDALTLYAPLLQGENVPKAQSIAVTQALNQAGQRQRAASLYTRLAAVYGDDEDYLRRLGAEALFAEHLGPAMDIFRTILEDHPEDATALKGSAMVMAENSNIRGAIERFREYNRLYPNDGDARYRLAELYTAQGRTGAAMGEYNKAAQLLRGRARAAKRDALRTAERAQGNTP